MSVKYGHFSCNFPNNKTNKVIIMVKTNERMFFDYAGIASFPDGSFKVKWSNDLTLCVKRNLVKNVTVFMTKLPSKMHKLEAIRYLLTIPEYTENTDYKMALDDCIDRYVEEIPKNKETKGLSPTKKNVLSILKDRTTTKSKINT